MLRLSLSQQKMNDEDHEELQLSEENTRLFSSKFPDLSHLRVQLQTGENLRYILGLH